MRNDQQLPERRKDDARVSRLGDDVAQLKVDVAQLKVAVQANTEMTQQIMASTSGLVEFFNDSRAAFRLFNKMMMMIRWFMQKAMLPFVFVAGVIYAATHHGALPAWIKAWFDIIQ